MLLRIVNTLLLSIITLSTSQESLLAASSASKQQLSIEELETLKQFEKPKETANELTTLIDRISRGFEQDCLSAFGHTSFCRCITDARPLISSFDNYIVAVTKTKEELEFNKLSKDDQKLVSSLRVTFPRLLHQS